MGRRKSTLLPFWDEKGTEMQATHPRSMKETENQETENQETWKSRK